MKLIKENFRICILLFAFWIVLTMNFDIKNLVVGLVISGIVTFVSNGILLDRNGFKIEPPKILIIIKFLSRLMFEIYKSSFSYILRIITKDCDPIFEEIELSVKNPLIITMISNAITLTPGTITVDTRKNKLVILVIDDPRKKGKDLTKEIIEKYESIFIGEDK